MFRTIVLFAVFCCITVTSSLAQQVDDSVAAQAPIRPAEDWSELRVDRALLKPLIAGVVLGKSETAYCTRELVRLEWRHGDAIDIYVMKPQSVAKPRVVLYLYSFPADIDRFRDDSWCQRNAGQQLAAVGFASALTGQRYHTRPMREWFVSELEESMGTSVHDVQLLLDYLASRGDLSVDQVGMFGQGSGASIAILAAAVDSRIAALDLLNPWGDWPDWLKSSPVVPDEERARYLTPEFLLKASKVEPVTYLPQLKDRAIRIQQIMDDTDTPDAAKEKIAAAAPANRVVQFKDQEAHHAAWKAAGLSGWLATQLGVRPQPVATAASGPSH